MDHDTGFLHTLTPLEPVLAKAAMEHRCQNENWSNSIQILTEELLDKGLIDRGHKGELYARLMLVLAHDWLREKEPHQNFNPTFKPTFTVQGFLIALYNEHHHKSILQIPSQILDAEINFNHFAPACENLSLEVISRSSYDL